tara:strand:+ start:5101 stop:5772 length:672 start_codon:yes stop_codon:yes gene_type:complete
MPNYKSRDNVPIESDEPKKKKASKTVNDVIGGALQMLDEYEASNPREIQSPPESEYERDNQNQDQYLANFVEDVKRQNEADPEAKTERGGSFHQKLIHHILKNMGAVSFHLLRHKAKQILSGGSAIGGELDMGAVSDIASAQNKHHLADMLENDYHLNREEDLHHEATAGGAIANAGWDAKHPRLSRDPTWYAGRGKERFVNTIKTIGKVVSGVSQLAKKNPF